MKKLIILIAVLVVIGIGIYYILPNNSYNSTSHPPVSATPSSEVPAAAIPSSASVTVNIKNFAFDPPALTVKAGTQVTWVNNDTVSHTVTSDSGSLLNSGTLAPGQSFSITLNTAGSASYHCKFHPMMKGSVIIEN